MQMHLPNAKQQVARLLDKISTSIWFVPATMGAGAVALALFVLQLDREKTELGWEWLNLLRIGADGVRQVFTVTTASMMTITGVTFSISIVALTLASNQFGPKVLRNYLTDRANKFILGLLVGTFVYGLTVLAFIDGNDDGFVPLLATILNLGLTVAAVFGMIYFIHNISRSIRAEQIIAVIARDLDHAIEKTLWGSGDQDDESCASSWHEATADLSPRRIRSTNSGYVQVIDYAALAAVAQKYDCYVALESRAGKFVIERGVVGHCFAREDIADDVLTELDLCVIVGRERTPIQDVEFAIDQLVQVALRALSPGINDPFTAITCIDWLSTALGRMSGQQFPASYVRDSDDTVRVFADSFSFAGAVNSVFDPLRQNALGNEMVMIRLLEALAATAAVTENADYRECLRLQAAMVYESAQRCIEHKPDLEAVEERYAPFRD